MRGQIGQSSNRFPILPSWSCGCPSKELKLISTTAQLSWLPIRKTTLLFFCVRFLPPWSFFICCCRKSSAESFWHHFRTNCRIEMANVEQTQEMIPFVTSEFPLVKMSASWFLVSMYLTWILGSKLIRSNNHSRATLWVRETCLIVGLLPFIIILITASLSSNTFNNASWRDDWTFEGTESMSSITSIFFWDLWRLWNITIRLPRSIWNTRNISKNRNN